MKKIVLLLAACMLAAGEMNAQKLSGREIIQKVKDRPDGNTRYAEMELTLRKKNGTTYEGVAIRLTVAAAKKGDGLIGKISILQNLQTVVPVVLQFSCAPC